MDFFGLPPSMLLSLAIGLSCPAFLSAFRSAAAGGLRGVETTLASTVLAGAVGLYLAAGGLLAAALSCMAGLVLARMLRRERERISTLAASIGCFALYLHLAPPAPGL